MAPVRVLVVDDSAFARKVIGDTLRGDPRFEVVGIARDGLEALEKISELKPDVVTLDLVMPNLDGVGVLRALPATDRPAVVIVSMSDSDSTLGAAALSAGAFDLVHKPTAAATDRLYELADDLLAKVAAAGTATNRPAVTSGDPVRPLSAPTSAKRSIIVIGASTGGPQALTHILRQMPADLPIPIAIVLHIPTGYIAAFAARLNEECSIRVVEARDGLELTAGTAVIAQAGIHLKIQKTQGRFYCVLDPLPFGRPHTPSVDILFESVASLGKDVLAVVLTGMGDDGLAGSRQLYAAGASILTEAESSCVVYGMPRTVAEAGFSAAEVPLTNMASAILRYI